MAPWVTHPGCRARCCGATPDVERIIGGIRAFRIAPQFVEFEQPGQLVPERMRLKLAAATDHRRNFQMCRQWAVRQRGEAFDFTIIRHIVNSSFPISPDADSHGRAQAALIQIKWNIDGDAHGMIERI